MKLMFATLAFLLAIPSVAADGDKIKIDPVISALETIAAESPFSEPRCRELLHHLFEGKPRLQIKLVLCLWALQDADFVRTEEETKYYEACWVALNDLFDSSDAEVVTLLDNLLCKLRLDGGERLAFEEKLEAQRKRLKIKR